MLQTALWGLLAAPLVAQRAVPVPQLSLNKLSGTWYQIARLPDKAEKKCLSDGTVLFALGYKPDTFQKGTFCTIKGGDHNNINDSGKQDKTHDGVLKVRHWVLFHRPYYLLAVGPDYDWALAGTPNHKGLWLLSRDPELAPEVEAQLRSTAAAQGYPVGKLQSVSHPSPRVTLSSPSGKPTKVQTATPSTTPLPTVTSH